MATILHASEQPLAMADDLAWAEFITLRLADSLPDSDEQTWATSAPPQAVSDQA